MRLLVMICGGLLRLRLRVLLRLRLLLCRLLLGGSVVRRFGRSIVLGLIVLVFLVRRSFLRTVLSRCRRRRLLFGWCIAWLTGLSWRLWL